MTEDLKNNVALALTETLSKMIDEEVKTRVANENKELILKINNLLQNISSYCRKSQEAQEDSYSYADELLECYVCDLESKLDDVKSSLDDVQYALEDLDSTIDEAIDFIDEYQERITE